jgi:hypothetical protein
MFASLTVIGAVLSQNSIVTLILSGVRTNDAGYTLTVRDVQDAAFTPNTLSSNPSTLPVSSYLQLISINGAAWKYYETTSASGLSGQPWMQPGFNDGAWADGSGIFFGHRSNSVTQPNPNPAAITPLVLSRVAPAGADQFRCHLGPAAARQRAEFCATSGTGPDDYPPC